MAVMLSDIVPSIMSVEFNATVTDLNSTDMMDGTMSDNMTAVDGAMGNDTMMMSNDSMMSNDTMMMSNEAGMTNAM